MPEIVVVVAARISDVELKLCSSAMMERPIGESCLDAEDLVARPAIQLFQLRSNVLKFADWMSRGQPVELICDGGNVKGHGPCLPLRAIDRAAPSRRTRSMQTLSA